MRKSQFSNLIPLDTIGTKISRSSESAGVIARATTGRCKISVFGDRDEDFAVCLGFLFLDTGETNFQVDVPLDRSQAIALIEVLARIINGAER
jgi:hypothetical protein